MAEIRFRYETPRFDRIFAPRRADTSKADYGNVVIFAGTSGMCGAAALSALSALRSGAGLVRAATLESNFVPIQTIAPEAICVLWSDAADDLSHYDAVAVGPGLGTGKEAREILRKVLSTYDGPLVIDADGLNTIAGGGFDELISAAKADIIMTPHAAEAARLLGTETGSLSRKELAERITEKYGCVCVSKGSGSVVTAPDGSEYVNSTGNPGMATPGSGDVLTGVITALCGQGCGSFDAAAAGCYIHGLAGDIACREKGERGMIARDIAGSLPQAFSSLARS